MATTFDVISLGILPIFDPVEGNQTVSQGAVNDALTTYGSADAPLFDQIVSFSPGSTGFAGGSSINYDLDNNQSNDTFRIDGGPDQIHDATMLFNATVTYKDGTTATITAVVFQDTNGNAYLAPELADNADQAVLEAQAIRSLTLNSPIYASGQTGRGFNLTADRDFANFVCFGGDTRIETEHGAVRAADVQVGERVRTADSGYRPVRWVGRRSFDRDALRAAPKLTPVRIRAGALGPGMPATDTLVSQQHRVLVANKVAERMFGASEILVAAKFLLNLDGVELAEDVDAVTYVHFTCDAHEVVFANGAPMETLLPGPNALAMLPDESRDELLTIFPELANAHGGHVPARKLVRGGRARWMAKRMTANGRAALEPARKDRCA